MNRLFGSKKKQEQAPPPAPAPEPPKPIDLGEQSEKLDARLKSLNSNVEQVEAEIAKYYQQIKNTKSSSQQQYLKQRVALLMKKRKMYQQQIDNLYGQQFTLDQVAFTKENIQNTLEMGKAMKEANQVQKDMMKDLNFDELENIRDEMEEMMWDTQEINDTLNRNYNIEVDDYEMEQELKDLDDEIFIQALNNKSEASKPSYLSEISTKKEKNKDYLN